MSSQASVGRGAGYATRLTVGPFTVLTCTGAPPAAYDVYCERARALHRFGRDGGDERDFWFVAVSGGDEQAAEAEWPYLVVAQHYALEAGTGVGIALLPERRRLFLGAGTRLLAFDLDPRNPRLLWEDGADYGFHDWRVTDGTVLMSAELELAAWDADGRKRWTTFVEPPWEYRLLAGQIEITVMGHRATFPLGSGPPPGSRWWP